MSLRTAESPREPHEHSQFTNQVSLYKGEHMRTGTFLYRYVLGRV